MRKFLLGVVLTLVALAAGVYWYAASGRAPVATSAAPMPFETRLAHLARNARIKREMPLQAAPAADGSGDLAAAALYRVHCAVCHGLPAQAPTAIASGMFPKPPQLFRGTGVSDDPAGETYWKVTNGIRLSGMPGFSGSLSDAERWRISGLLARSNQLSAPVVAALSQPLGN